jgi:hypothetical protein
MTYIAARKKPEDVQMSSMCETVLKSKETSPSQGCVWEEGHPYSTVVPKSSGKNGTVRGPPRGCVGGMGQQQILNHEVWSTDEPRWSAIPPTPEDLATNGESNTCTQGRAIEHMRPQT